MAVNQNQSYAETLREMRTTRMQQLRQGNSQSQLMSRQTAVLSSMNNMLSKQSQMMSRLESSQRASNQQLVSVNRNLTSLSSTLSRSLSNFAASVARGAGGGARAVGGAAVDAGGAAAGAAGSIATSIASGIGRVLPLAIAGYVVKSVSWDNMSQQTQDKISGSMGRLFDKAIKEIDSTEIGNSLTKALTPAFDQLKSLTKKLGEEIDAVKAKLPSASQAKESVENKLEQAKEKYQEVKPSIEKGIKRAKIGGQARLETTQEIFKGVSGLLPDELPGVPGVSPGEVATGVGVTSAAIGAAKILKPPATVSKPGGNPKANFSGFKSRKPPSKATTDAIKFMAQNPGLKGKEGLLASRIISRAASGAGAAGRFLEALKKYKLAASGSFMVLGAVIHYWDYKVVKREIELMAEEGIFDQKEVDFLVGRLQAEDWGSFFGSTVLGTLGAVGGSVGGPVGTVVGGATGGYVGSKTGGSAAASLFEKFNPRPASLDQEVSTSSFQSTSDIANKGFDTRYGKKTSDATSTSKPGSSSTPTAPSNYVPGSDAAFVKNRAQREGVRMNPYVSPEGGNPTIGLGHKLTDAEMKAGGVFIGGKLVKLDLNKLTARGGKETGPGQLTKQQVDQLAEEDHKKHEEAARKWIGADVFDKLTPDQQWSLGDLSYAGGYSAFKDGQLRKMVRAGDHQGAAKYISNWGLYYTAQSDIKGGPKKGEKVYNPHMARGSRGRAELYAGTTKLPGGDTMLASNKPTSAATIPQAANMSATADATSTSTPAAAVTPTTAGQSAEKDQTAWGGITAVAEAGKGKVAKMVESADEKRKRSIKEMFSSTLASLDPERLKSDLLEQLEIAKSVMMGSGESGGTTVINNDNSTTSSQSGGGGSTSKSVYPDYARSNVDHSTTMWGGRPV